MDYQIIKPTHLKVINGPNKNKWFFQEHHIESKMVSLLVLLPAFVLLQKEKTFCNWKLKKLFPISLCFLTYGAY